MSVGVDIDRPGEGVRGEHVEVLASALGVLHLQRVIARRSDAQDIDDSLAAVVEWRVAQTSLGGWRC